MITPTAGTSSLRNELIHQSSDTNLGASVTIRKEEDVKMDDIEVKVEEGQDVEIKVEDADDVKVKVEDEDDVKIKVEEEQD